MLHIYDVPAPPEPPRSASGPAAAISHQARMLDALMWEHACRRHVTLAEMRGKVLEIIDACDRFLADVCGEQ